MSVILGLVFLGIAIGNGIWRNRKAMVVSQVPLSKVDEKIVVLRLR